MYVEGDRLKGRYAYSFLNSPKRLSRSVIREAGRWKEISWDEALDHCARELQRISAIYGPDSIGILGSARATNEENYLAQKFACIVLGTNNVDCCVRVCHTPSAAAMKAMLGAGAATNSFDDIEHAHTFFGLWGELAGKPSHCWRPHQAADAAPRRQSHRADPRKTELARLADIHLALRPGSNIPLLNALAHVIVTEGLVDLPFLRERVCEWEAFHVFVAEWPPICQVAEADIRAAARLYAQAKPSMSFHGLGLTEHIQGTEGVMALVNLALLTGNIARHGGVHQPLARAEQRPRRRAHGLRSGCADWSGRDRGSPRLIRTSMEQAHPTGPRPQPSSDDGCSGFGIRKGRHIPECRASDPADQESRRAAARGQGRLADHLRHGRTDGAWCAIPVFIRRRHLERDPPSLA